MSRAQGTATPRNTKKGIPIPSLCPSVSQPPAPAHSVTLSSHVTPSCYQLLLPTPPPGLGGSPALSDHLLPPLSLPPGTPTFHLLRESPWSKHKALHAPLSLTSAEVDSEEGLGAPHQPLPSGGGCVWKSRQAAGPARKRRSWLPWPPRSESSK